MSSRTAATLGVLCGLALVLALLAFVAGRETGRHESYHFKIERDDARDQLEALVRFDRLIIEGDARMIRSFRPCP